MTHLLGKQKVYQIMLTLVMVAGLLFPTGGIVNAEESDPPVAPDSIISVDPTLLESEPLPIQEPSTVPFDEIIQTTVEGVFSPTEAVITTGQGTSLEPVIEEVIQANTLLDEVAALAEAGAILMENGEPLTLISNTASDSLENADPYFTRGGITYNFYQTGGTCSPSTFNVTCFVSATPIQDAINKFGTITPLPGEVNTIYVLPGIYAERITINVPNLTLYGTPGNATTAGPDVNAPVLQGSGGTGIQIQAQGVTITGFIIQGYDIGIYVNVENGNTDIKIVDNLIQNNGIGIKVIKDRGSPGVEIHYNQFYNNRVALENSDDNNIQYINAENNFWGCTSGPVVFGKLNGTGNSPDLIGYWDVYSATYIGTTLPNDCQLLGGYQPSWDHKKNTGNWNPYKIVLDTKTPTALPTNAATATPVTPSATPVTPSSTPVTPTNTATDVPDTATPSATPVTPTNTATDVPDTATPSATPVTPTNTATDAPDTATPVTPTNTATDVPASATPISPTTPPVTPTSMATGVPIIPVTGAAPVPLAATGFFIPVTGGSRIIAAGLDHTCMTVGTEVACWGLNDSGQLGNGNTVTQLVPNYVLNLKMVTNLTAGSLHTCALTEAGEVWCWGENSSGQLGNGTTQNSNVPVMVKGLPGPAADLTAGNNFTCAKLENFEIWCWGNNKIGQLNDGTKINRSVPVKAQVSGDLSLISGGQDVLVSDSTAGEVGAWKNKQTDVVSNVVLPQVISANRFAPGGCASTLSGTVNCWKTDLASTQVDGITAALLVDTGKNHSCTINEDLTVSCWGANPYGELGNGTTNDSGIALSVPKLSGVQDLALGEHHTCVLAGDGMSAFCWGENSLGQLGNSTINNSSSPVLVSAPVR